MDRCIQFQRSRNQSLLSPSHLCPSVCLLRPAVFFLPQARSIQGHSARSEVPTAPPFPVAHPHCTLPVQGGETVGAKSDSHENEVYF